MGPLPADAEAVCDAALVMQGSGLTTGGRLPDSYKPGPDGVSWGGMGLGKASWTEAQCGDCLSAQALGHAATPHWARAPALGFQRDVTGDWLSLSVAGSPLQQLLQCHPPHPTPPHLPHVSAPSPSQPCKCPSTSFTVSAVNPGSLPHRAIPTTSAHVWMKRGEVVLLHCTHLPQVFPCCGP